MIFVIYLFGIVLTIGLGLLALWDRIFGIVGGLFGFLFGIYMLNENALSTVTVYDSKTASWILYNIPQNEMLLLAIVIGILALLDFLIVIGASR